MPKKNFIPKSEVPWVSARQKFHLSDAQIQMARELGMKPDGLGKFVNYEQQRWKVPLPQFIEEQYFKRFNKQQPDIVKSIEQVVLERRKKDEARKAKKAEREGKNPAS
ncbi:MAG: hypothetical protein JWN70_5727 [Planctomycetaceae bacterium]|nr:hypothetical protein [Planctomycetaceae bacterium]